MDGLLAEQYEWAFANGFEGGDEDDLKAWFEDDSEDFDFEE